MIVALAGRQDRRTGTLCAPGAEVALGGFVQVRADEVDEAVDIERLGEKAVALMITRFAERAHQQHRGVQAPVRLNASRQLETIHAWELNVANHHVWMFAINDLQGGFCIPGSQRIAAEVTKNDGDKTQNRGFVVYNQAAGAHFIRHGESDGKRKRDPL